MIGRIVGTGLAALAMLIAPLPAAQAQNTDYAAASLDQSLERRLAMIAAEGGGRIGVSAVEIGGSRQVTINGGKPFPMASTMKIAVAAAYLKGVDEGRYNLDTSYPLKISTGKTGSDGKVITRDGTSLTAQSLIELMITKSDNQATDGLLAAVGGPDAVNAWLRRAGIQGQQVDRSIATLLRDDLEKNDPSLLIDRRDSSTPEAMVHLLSAIYQGDVLSPASREVLLGAMTRCRTGRNRLKGALPGDTLIAHKTGTLYNQTSDVGIIRLPDGRAFAIAVFATGAGSHTDRAGRISTIARTVYDSFMPNFSYGG